MDLYHSSMGRTLSYLKTAVNICKVLGCVIPPLLLTYNFRIPRTYFFDSIAQYREKVKNVRKHQLFLTKIKSIKNTDILEHFERFLGTEQSDQIDSFS